MNFDWIGFLESRGIDYVTSGKNVAANHVNIKCPYCTDDPSEHMGLSLVDGMWACWRNASHRGRDPFILAAVIGHVSRAELIETYGAALDLKKPPNVSRLFEPAGYQEHKPVKLQLDPSFRKIDGLDANAKRFLKYLQNRGFDGQAEAVCEYFQLMYAAVGWWNNRVIVPFFDREQRLVGWSGRAILHSGLRYDTKGERVLFNDIKDSGEILVIVEGPFDCMKMWAVGFSGIHVVATLGTAPDHLQVARLWKLTRRFRRSFVMFDSDAGGPALALANSIGAQWLPLLDFHDPGEMPIPLAKNFLGELLC
jgi:hypothetical protein